MLDKGSHLGAGVFGSVPEKRPQEKILAVRSTPGYGARSIVTNTGINRGTIAPRAIDDASHEQIKVMTSKLAHIKATYFPCHVGSNQYSTITEPPCLVEPSQELAMV